MWVCSERLQATLRIHYVGGRTSLSLQSHRPDAQDSVLYFLPVPHLMVNRIEVSVPNTQQECTVVNSIMKLLFYI